MAKLPGAKYMPCGQRIVLFGNIEQVLCPAEPGAGFYNLAEVDLPCVFCIRNKSQATAEETAPAAPEVLAQLKTPVAPAAAVAVLMEHTPPHGPSDKQEKRRRR